jgi:biotin carboxyl carrier protein
MDKRPGLYLDPIDFAKVKKELGQKYGGPVTETDIASYVMYPKVFEDYKKFVKKYGDLSVLPTKYFLSAPQIGEEFHVELEKGKVLILKLLAVGPLSENTGQREVFYEMNGEVRQVAIDDQKASVENVTRPKADPSDSSQVGAPMSGVLVELRVHDGTEVKKGDPLAVLSAMKMVSCLGIRAKGVSLTGRRKWLSQRHTMVLSRRFRSRRATRWAGPTWYAGSRRSDVWRWTRSWAACMLSREIEISVLEYSYNNFRATQAAMPSSLSSNDHNSEEE